MALKILVVGGAGYIGSHMVKRLGTAGVEVVTLDNLSSGHRDAVTCGEFVHGDIADRALLDTLFASRRFDAVMHFASHIEVGESVRLPLKYYRNNVSNTLTLLEAIVAVLGFRDGGFLGAWHRLRYPLANWGEFGPTGGRFINHDDHWYWKRLAIAWLWLWLWLSLPIVWSLR